MIQISQFVFLLSVVSGLAIGCATPNTASAQSGLRDSLELLDRNQNGSIEPDEITPLARPYLERVADARRMSLDRSNDIEKWQEAARIYYAMQNGVAGTRIDVSSDRALKSFRPDDDQPMVPEFGLAEVKYPYTPDDLDEADDTLRRYDRNRDGYMDRREASRGRWSHRDPFSMDFNKDDRLSRLELAQRYARRRMLSDDSDELIQRARRTGNGIRPTDSDDDDDDRGRGRSDWWRSGGDRYWLTASILGRFDANRNGRLEFSETTELGIPTGAIDADQNGELSREELFAYFKNLQDQTGDLVDGLPSWFYELDTNRDQQIELTEFATELSDAKVAEFVALDSNQDGLLQAAEVMASKSMMGGSFENHEAEMLPPRKTIVSEIEIEEAFLVADLNVKLTITHTNVSSLDGYLTGPDGTRIELFSGVGGRDDHFEKTVFDDQAERPITKGRPPFEGSYQPEGLVKHGPGLAVFNGKSIQGVWQLTIRCSESDRFGMLHRWAILARPDEETLLDLPEPETAPQPDTGQPQPTATAQDAANASLPLDLVQAITADSTASYWTAERKAEFAAKVRTPSPEQWAQLSDDEKRQKLAERKQAIAQYKAALASKSNGSASSAGSAEQ
ncbi:proprotein convertase P-domain-containing protein [Stieleria sp. TO1_6]|uniref:proprotein convertase P-domain-containing protein n=1 Tax=Stieleria tagensis TaxID=2956795 RepID=UPI00209AA456|nr:proprotein convertase P-domain-containing protein [Stieleria tagensis]MCO8124235.1 proprotein convertase P-domain-containing protein [Stieleria tagensis]